MHECSHIYELKYTWMSIHITHTHENTKTTKIKLLHYHASELCLHKWKDINQQLRHWPAHVFILTSHNITHYSLWNLSRYLTKGKCMQTVWYKNRKKMSICSNKIKNFVIFFIKITGGNQIKLNIPESSRQCFLFPRNYKA